MLLGCDVSYWQGPMEWQTTKEAGAKFAFIRAGSCRSTDGVNYTDFQFENNAEFAHQFLPVGFYWYFRPNFSPASQADYFGDLIEPESWSMPPVLDLETTGGLSKTALTDACAEFISRVYSRFQIWPLVYSRSIFLHDFTVDHQIWHECDLWIARYTGYPLPWGNPGDTNSKLKPPYWDDWTFWQYIAESNAAVKYGGAGPPNGDDDIDLNYFNGDEQAFNEYIGAPPPAPNLPPEIGVKLNVEIDGQDVKYQGKVQLVD